mmetsp:Transcript_23754/g.45179  ORF Transcript_23754/g.45179 Transcript_23754/m.45179 type:complete len:382 (-) Transcript_23754:218-1363(-)
MRWEGATMQETLWPLAPCTSLEGVSSLRHESNKRRGSPVPPLDDGATTSRLGGHISASVLRAMSHGPVLGSARHLINRVQPSAVVLHPKPPSPCRPGSGSACWTRVMPGAGLGPGAGSPRRAPRHRESFLTSTHAPQGYPAASASTTQSSAGLQPRQLVSGGELALGDGRVARRREMVRMNSFLDRCITNANMRHESVEKCRRQSRLFKVPSSKEGSFDDALQHNRSMATYKPPTPTKKFKLIRTSEPSMDCNESGQPSAMLTLPLETQRRTIERQTRYSLVKRQDGGGVRDLLFKWEASRWHPGYAFMASRRGEYEDKASVRESMCLLRELQGSQRLNSGHSLFLENAMVKGVESARMRSALHVARGVRSMHGLGGQTYR